jgi:hypothetical protein
MPSIVKKLPETFKTYEDGKHRRYALLFSVNGGAFAIAKLLAATNPPPVLGSLSLQHLAVGLIAFTILMAIDIYFFGTHLRSTVPVGEPEAPSEYVEMFGPIGQGVLFLLSVLICAGWWFAATPGP